MSTRHACGDDDDDGDGDGDGEAAVIGCNSKTLHLSRDAIQQ